MRAFYNEEEVKQRLIFLSEWKFQENKIEREFLFKNFADAFAFLTRIAMLSEKYNHHAEIYNAWNRVILRYTTHDAGGVTDKDLKMAEEINKLV